MTEYKYRVENDPHTGEKRAEVENVGFVPLNDSEGEDKIKTAIALQHNLDENDVEVKKVDDLNSGPITSDQVTSRSGLQVDDLQNQKSSKKNK